MSIQPLPGKNVCLKERKQNKTKRHEISEYPGNRTLYVSYFSLGDLEAVLHECIYVIQDLLEALKPILDEDLQEAVESLLMDSAIHDAKSLYYAMKVTTTLHQW